MQSWNARQAASQKTQSDSDDLQLKEYLAEPDARTWWDYNRENTIALGLDDSMNAVKSALEKQRFDVSDDYLHGSFIPRVTKLICGS